LCQAKNEQLQKQALTRLIRQQLFFVRLLNPVTLNVLSVRRQRKATETGADAPDQAVAFFCTAAQPSHPKRAICVQAENEQLRKQAQSLLIRQQLFFVRPLNPVTLNVLSVRRQRKATETGADAPDQAAFFFCYLCAGRE